MSGIILYSDPHFSNRSAFGKYISNAIFPGCNSRFHEIAATFRNVANYAIKNDCEAIFILGDVFHERGVIQVPVYNAVYCLLKEYTQKIKIVMFPGNHDMVDLKAMHADRNLHSLLMYEKLITFVGQPSVIETDSFHAGIIPFSIDKEQILKYSKDLLNNKSSKKESLLMMHHSFSGAVTGPHEWVMPHELKVTELHKGWDHYFSGHCHKHQKVGNLYYVGAPLHHDNGERNYTPGFIHVQKNGTWKHIENKTSPRFNLLETSNEEDIKTLDPNDYNVIRWLGDNRQVLDMKGTLPDNCIVESKPSSLNVKARTDIKTTDSVEEMLSKYVEAKKGNPDKEIVKQGKLFYEGKS